MPPHHSRHHARLGARALAGTQATLCLAPVCACRAWSSALGALGAGRGFVEERIGALAEQKAIVLEALAPLGPGAVNGGSGAIYLFCRLPAGCEDDVAAVRWLVETHGVCLIPGSACGMPGHVRVCYANLPLERTRDAARRLRAGLEQLAAGAVDLAKA